MMSSQYCFAAEAFDGSRHFIKKCNKSYVYETNIDNPWNEISALSIISLIGSDYFPSFITAIEDDQYICVISEYVEGVDLFDRVQQSKHGLPVDKAQRYLIQISHAVRQLHEHNLAHLDLSTENIMIDKHDNIKLLDFGVCTKILAECKSNAEYKQNSSNESDSDCSQTDEKRNDTNLTYSKHRLSRLLPGKAGYRAPEIEARKQCDPRLADAFSVGYIAWTLLHGHMPFASAHPDDAEYREFMQLGAEQWREKVCASMSGWELYKNGEVAMYDKLPPNAIQMLDELLACNTYKRRSIEELLDDSDSFLHHECDEKKSEEKQDMERVMVAARKESISSYKEIDTKLMDLQLQFSH